MKEGPGPDFEVTADVLAANSSRRTDDEITDAFTDISPRFTDNITNVFEDIPSGMVNIAMSSAQAAANAVEQEKARAA